MIDKTEIKNTTGLVWFGNDLRIHDNDVLSLAVKNHSKVIGIYIIDPSLFEENEFGFKKMDVFRAQFLLESLHDLKHQLFTKNILYQTATFRPKGVAGRLYWYLVTPLHWFVFNGMINRIIKTK